MGQLLTRFSQVPRAGRPKFEVFLEFEAGNLRFGLKPDLHSGRRPLILEAVFTTRAYPALADNPAGD